MVNFVRLIFVVFLVLLQLVAPLIHAHKNEHFNVVSSFHLPEFEQVNALLDKHSKMIAPSFHEGEMVTVSAGVKENQRDFSSDDLNFFIAFILIFSVFQRVLHLFSVYQTESIKCCRYFSQASPRASPLLTF